MVVGGINSMKYPIIPEGIETTTQVRYNDKGVMSRLNHEENGNIGVEFFADVKGIAPGQSAVFYEGDDVVGGGIIRSNPVDFDFISNN